MTIKIDTTRSSMLKSIVYSETEQTLTVEFNNGGSYCYMDVPKNVFDELVGAESEGKYFLANIKSKFECEKV